MYDTHPARKVCTTPQNTNTRSLPPRDTDRWVASRKAQVVAAVESGMLTVDEVLTRYNLSLAEFYGWKRAMERAGVSGLRVAWASQDRANLRRERKAQPQRLALSELA